MNATSSLAAPPALDDAALAQRLIDGDALAAAEAWRRFAPYVRRIVRGRFTSLGDADDLLQDVFLQFFARVSTLRDLGALRTFLMGVCLRTGYYAMRRRAVRRGQALTYSGRLPDVVVAPGDVDARATLRRYLAVVARLSDGLRGLYVSRHFDGLHLAEVAHRHGVSVATARRRLRRAESVVSAIASADPLLSEWSAGARARRATSRRTPQRDARRRASPSSISAILRSLSG